MTNLSASRLGRRRTGAGLTGSKEMTSIWYLIYFRIVSKRQKNATYIVVIRCKLSSTSVVRVIVHKEHILLSASLETKKMHSFTWPFFLSDRNWAAMRETAEPPVLAFEVLFADEANRATCLCQLPFSLCGLLWKLIVQNLYWNLCLFTQRYGVCWVKSKQSQRKQNNWKTAAGERNFWEFLLSFFLH